MKSKNTRPDQDGVDANAVRYARRDATDDAVIRVAEHAPLPGAVICA